MIISDQSIGSAVGEINAIPFHQVVRYRVQPVEDAFVIKAVLTNGAEVVVGWEGSMDRVLETLEEIDEEDSVAGEYRHFYDATE